MMASLTKRGNYWSIIFKKRIDDKPIRKTYALGTKYKKVAEHKKTKFEKLYHRGEIDPFDENWNLKEYEEGCKTSAKTAINSSYYLEDLKEDFLTSKSHTSIDTQKAYKYIIKLFIEDVGISMTANLVRPLDIRTFCLQERLATATQRTYLRHLKAFFNWVADKGIIEINPCNDVHPPNKKDKLVDKIIREDQLQNIFHTFQNLQAEKQKAGYIMSPKQKQFWFKPIITTAFYTGMRRKELLQLRWEHIDLKGREVHITDTKSGQERSVVLFDQAYLCLKAWNRFYDYPTNGLVFPSPKSNKHMEIKLTGGTVSKTFKSIIRKSDIKNTMHFHGLRHSCATFMLRQGFNVIEVKEMLGHKSIEITYRYVHLISDDRKNKAEQLGLITNNHG
jgi:integrase